MVVAFSVKAQKEAQLFVTNSVDSKGGTSIKWITKEVVTENGFLLYRNIEGSSDWIKVNNEPIQIKRNLEESNFDIEKDKTFYKTLKNHSYNQIQSNNLLKVFIVLQAIESNQFAEAAGVMTHDVYAKDGSRVRYKLTELQANGETELGVSSFFDVGSAQVLLPPDSIVIDRSEKAVQMSWKPEELRYFGVEVWRSENGGSPERINSLLARTQKNGEGKYPDYFYADNEVVGGSEYEYTLVSVNYFGQRSKPSNPIKVGTVLGDDKEPTIITSLSTIGPKKQVKVIWRPITDADLLGYHVWVRNGDEEPRRATTDLMSASDTAFVFTEEKIGSKYVQIETVYKQGNKKSYWGFTELFDQLGPKAPTDFAISVDTGKFIMTWNVVNDADLVGYKIYRKLANNKENNWYAVNSTPLDTNFYELNISSRVASEFSYYVVAQDRSFNESEASNMISAKQEDISSPDQPILISCKAVEIDANTDGIELQWLANGESDLGGYNLYRRIKDDSTEMEQVNYKLLPIEVLRYIDRFAESGVRYEYRLEAIDSNGLKSELSDPFYGQKSLKVENLLPKNIDVKSNSKKKTIEISWAESASAALAGYTLFAGNSKNELRPKSGMFQTNNYKFDAEPGTYYLQLKAIAINGTVVRSEIIETTIKSK